MLWQPVWSWPSLWGKNHSIDILKNFIREVKPTTHSAFHSKSPGSNISLENSTKVYRSVSIIVHRTLPGNRRRSLLPVHCRSSVSFSYQTRGSTGKGEEEGEVGQWPLQTSPWFISSCQILTSFHRGLSSTLWHGILVSRETEETARHPTTCISKESYCWTKTMQSC